jgi:hypothetical protein
VRTYKRAQIGTNNAALDTDQHHANFALGAARSLDHARGMRFRHVMQYLCVPKIRFGVDAASGRRKLAS